ncbi:MAG: tripartite tricarboxylate transporter TctB family protein [Clostridia bacterium]|nr:tripartite tricarboxylate transporter TctB family protein [Clostridia bacterium]
MKVFKKWNKSLWTGVVFSLVAVAYLIGSYSIGPSAKRFGIFGAAFMPRLYGAVLLLCAVIQLVVGIRQYRKEKDKEIPEPTEAEKKEKLLNARNVAVGFVLIFLYMLSMKTLGFVISSAIFLFCLCNLLLPKTKDRKKAQLGIVLLAVLLPTLSYLFFKNVVYMALPAGPIFHGVI